MSYDRPNLDDQYKKMADNLAARRSDMDSRHEADQDRQNKQKMFDLDIADKQRKIFHKTMKGYNSGKHLDYTDKMHDIMNRRDLNRALVDKIRAKTQYKYSNPQSNINFSKKPKQKFKVNPVGEKPVDAKFTVVKEEKMENVSEDIAVDFLVRITEMMKPAGKPKPVDPKKAAMDEKRKKYVPGGGINPKHAPKGGNIKEATYQAGKAKSPDKYGVRRGTAKLSKSSVKGVSSEEAKHASRRNQERDFHLQRDAKFRKQHGSMSAAERRRENQLMNRPMGLRKKDPEDHYPQD